MPRPDSKKKAEANPSGAATTATAASLNRLVASGDNRGARALARKLLAESTSEDDRRVAQDILRRTGVDPAAMGVALGAIVLVAALIGLVLLH